MLQKKRAQEELQLLAKEWRRLWVWIYDRERQFDLALETARKELANSPPAQRHSQKAAMEAMKRYIKAVGIQHRKSLRDLQDCRETLQTRGALVAVYSTAKKWNHRVKDLPAPSNSKAAKGTKEAESRSTEQREPAR
jgi:hypothetical protein